MTLRELPPQEWGRLVGTEARDLAVDPRPQGWRVLVVEDSAGEIIGTWAMKMLAHTEAFSIREDHQKRAGVFRLLLAGMRALLVAEGQEVAYTAAVSEEVRLLLLRYGATQLPGVAYVWPVRRPVEEESPCLQS